MPLFSKHLHPEPVDFANGCRCYRFNQKMFLLRENTFWHVYCFIFRQKETGKIDGVAGYPCLKPAAYFQSPMKALRRREC